jgi:ribosomal-protein-alanine N-acetyltransferase
MTHTPTATQASESEPLTARSMPSGAIESAIMTLQPTIRPMGGEAEARCCAAIMSASEPWVTLGRAYGESLAMLQDPNRRVDVAVVAGDVVGFIVTVRTGAVVGYVQSVAVAEPWRARGIGSLLLDRAESELLAEFHNVFICVSSFNHAARRLYTRRGYVVVGELTDYLVRGHSEWLLRLTRGPR